MKKFFKRLLIVCGISLTLTIILLSIPKTSWAALSKYGLPGIYNATPITLEDEQGAALAIDSSGYLIMSTTSQISANFSSTESTNITYVSSTAITADYFYGDGSGLTGLASKLSDLENPDANTVLNIGSYELDFITDGTNYLDIGTGSNTTTIAAGAAGNTTTTFAGDVSLENAYLGQVEFQTDAGIVDWANMALSSSATADTRYGYNFTMDGTLVMSVGSLANGTGEASYPRVGIGTMYPDAQLTISSSTPKMTLGDGSATTTVSGVYSADPCGSAGTGELASSTFYFSIGGFPCYCNGAEDDLKIVDDSACTY